MDLESSTRTHRDADQVTASVGEHTDVADPADRNGHLLVSVIVPTKDEAGNVESLIRRLEPLAPQGAIEIIFVDDSTDGTEQVVAAMLARSEGNIKLLHRPPDRRNGLAGAVVEGLRMAHGRWVCVMDGDLQHPPELIPQLVEKGERENADLVLASRYCEEGDGRRLGFLRGLISRGSTAAARLLFWRQLRNVSDPLSGFFVVRTAAVDPDRLRPNGFKILLEILVRVSGLRVAEVPFAFGKRHAGESKASLREGLRYLSHLWRLRVGEGTFRFGLFAFVGGSGLAVNMLLLALGAEAAGLHYLVAAALATQGSTLWNFGLTEFWVFPDRRGSTSTLLRLGLFLLMNNLALLLRGPLLFGLTSGLGIHYLVSNLASLLILTLLRFALADTWIWARPKPKGGEPAVYGYDIHGIISVQSDTRLPELERFRKTEPIEQPTIRVRTDLTSRRRREAVAAPKATTLRFAENLGAFGFAIDVQVGEQIDVRAAPVLRRSPHVLYTNVVEPILRWRFVEAGYALVHGACIAFGNEAILVTAKTDTGKTTTILRMLDRERCSFLSDDLTLLCPDGRVLMYPKPLTISRHTVGAVHSPLLSRRERLALVLQSRVHSRSGRIFAHLISKTRLPAATINTLVQLLVPPPKYQIDRLVPEVDILREARLAGLVVIERGGEGEARLEHQETVDTLMSNCEDAYGFPPYHEIEGFLHSSNGKELRPAERALVAGALTGLPALVVRSKSMDWMPGLAAFVNEHLHARLRDHQDSSGTAHLTHPAVAESSFEN